MKSLIYSFIKGLPLFKEQLLQIEKLKVKVANLKMVEDKYKTWVPPGHYYSPIPSLEETRLHEEKIFQNIPRELIGINLNESMQISLFQEFRQYYKELPFEDCKQESLRYFYENPAYSYSDAIFLYCMIRHTRPKKVIEVGSGYSSCMTLDVNELYFDNKISCTFIEPYPELLLSLMKERDKDRVEIISNNLQDVELEKFSELSAGDILFIDSTHVSKINSDVNYILFEILPNLNSGVYIHFHDIFYPFEYPKDWIYEGRAWNEDYILRTFLMYNDCFEIIFFNTFLEHFYKDMFIAEMPLCMKNTGASLWIQKK
jgi:predicted O-methyltransferase YrrM